MKSRKERKKSVRAESDGLSRREFARGATVAAAAIAAIPGTAGAVLAGAALTSAHDGHTSGGTHGSASTDEKPKLSAEAQAEVEAKIAEILRRYGERLSDAQRTDIRRLVREAQEPLETLRRYKLANSDEPATVLHLARAEERAPRERKPRAAAEGSKRPGA